jgi:hypothetical protein
MSKEKPNPLKLVNEIVIGIYTQISGLEHELSTVVNMQQRSMTVNTAEGSSFFSYINRRKIPHKLHLLSYMNM